MKLKKRISETSSVRSPVRKAVTLILLPSFMKRMKNTPARGRKITVERIGNPKGFIVRYGNMVSYSLKAFQYRTYKTSHRIAKNRNSERPI